MGTKAAPTADVIEAFLVSARARNCSPKYIGKLAYTLGFLQRAHPTLPRTTEELESFLAGVDTHLKRDGKPLGDETRAEILLSIRRLYCWITERANWKTNPMAPIRRARRKSKLPRVLSQRDVDRILDANTSSPREFALLSVMLDTMARLGEVNGLTWEHVRNDDDGPSLHFPETGKQGARSAPLNPSTVTALTRASGAGPLWTKSDGAPLSYYGIRRAFRNALDRAGIKGNPHLMRHTAATLYVKNGGDLFSLMRIGGWSTLKAVQMYVNLANSDVRDQHAKFSPMARRSAEREQQLHLLEETGTDG